MEHRAEHLSRLPRASTSLKACGALARLEACLPSSLLSSAVGWANKALAGAGLLTGWPVRAMRVLVPAFALRDCAC